MLLWNDAIVAQRTTQWLKSVNPSGHHHIRASRNNGAQDIERATRQQGVERISPLTVEVDHERNRASLDGGGAPVSAGNRRLERDGLAAPRGILSGGQPAQPFWRDQNRTGTVVDTGFPITASFDDSPPDGAPGVVFGFVGGDNARSYNGMSPGARAEAWVKPNSWLPFRNFRPVT